MTAKWTAVGSEKTTAVWVKDENGKTVCNVARCDDDWNRASLIAAAPDLLQALENLTDAVQSGTSYADDTAAGKALSILSGRSGTTWLSDARAAIAKAKGE